MDKTNSTPYRLMIDQFVAHFCSIMSTFENLVGEHRIHAGSPLGALVNPRQIRDELVLFDNQKALGAELN